ncbi:unnamed protein product [Closterium sp. NIES-53]
MQPSGDVHHVRGFNGNVALQGEAGKKVLIPDVLYVPGVQANLVLVGQLKESGVKLQVDGDKLQLVLVAGDVLGRAHYTGRVLCTDLHPCLTKSTSVLIDVVALRTIASATKSTPDMWHARLAHVSVDTIKSSEKQEVATDLVIKPSAGTDLLCVSCVGGKLARHTFPHKGSDAEEPLAVVHIDLCGPFRVAAKDGSVYLILLKNQKAHFMWVKLVAKKSDVLQLFEKWLSEAVWVRNSLEQSTLQPGMTLHQLLTGKKPDLTLACVWGCMVQFVVPEQQRGGKLAPKARWGLHFEVSLESKGWEVLDLADNKLVTTVEAIFYETMLLEVWKVKYGPASGRAPVIPPTLASSGSVLTSPAPTALLPAVPSTSPLVADLPKLTSLSAIGTKGRIVAAPDHGIAGGRRDEVHLGAQVIDDRGADTRGANGRGAVNRGAVVEVARGADGGREVGRGADIGTNARQVVKGFTQVYNVDYDKTYAPVRSYITLSIFLNIVIVLELHLMQLDMKNDFLQSKLDQVLYMYQPNYYDDGTSRVCKLLKRLYGLKQSPLLWYSALDDVLTGAGWRKSQVDEPLYFKQAYVDKMLLRFMKTSVSIDAYVELTVDDEEFQSRKKEEYWQKSEYMAVTEAGKKARRLRFLLAEFQLLDAWMPIIMRVDNQSAITVAEGLGLRVNLKHMERRYIWLHLMVKRGKFTLKYIPTIEQPADFLTKAQHFLAFNRCSVALGQVVGGPRVWVTKHELGKGVLTEVGPALAWANWNSWSEQVDPSGSILCMGPPNTSATATLSIARLGRAQPTYLARGHFSSRRAPRGARRFSDRRATLGAARRPTLPIVRPVARGGALPVARPGAHGGFVARGARARPPSSPDAAPTGARAAPIPVACRGDPGGGRDRRGPRVGLSCLRRGPALHLSCPGPVAALPPLTSLPAIYGPALC